MKKIVLLAAAACALLAPTVTPAQLLLGGQASFALPFGDVEEAAPLGDFARFAAPLELRAAWRVTPRIALGLQGGWGWASVGDSWDEACGAAGLDCSAHLWRLAARGEYAFGQGIFRPFVAATLGWEWLVERWEQTGDNWERRTYGGPTLGLEGGADFAVARRFSLGFFAGVSAGAFLAQWVEGEIVGYGYEDSAEVGSPGAHGWFAVVGARGTFQLF